ncbi:hypothetical protein CMI47_19975 [Candidatus Pacearchaeota archaeon]|jgi:flagellin-like hook-associated protein FlgL|nr:hypothetical protein [Candidatus Pacearchaeota archaeon]|tara:strand:+ start:2834 stop:3664 length:831 start_codon:yes stop_codon:yes gene_type:complete
MAQPTADQHPNREIFDGAEHLNELPLKTSTTIFAGAYVGENSGARQLNAGDAFLGLATAKRSNVSGTGTDTNCLVSERGLVVDDVVGASAATDVLKPVYASDGDTLTLTKSTNSRVGHIHRWQSGTECVVYFEAKYTSEDTDDLTVEGLTVTGAASLDGGVDIGDAAADLVGFHGAAAVDQHAAIETITDSSGGVDPGDDIIAALGTITNYDAHASGAVAVTSNAATDLDTAAAALDTLEDEVTQLRLDIGAAIAQITDKVNDVSDTLREKGLIAT